MYCYIGFKLNYLKNLKLFSIRVKELFLFEPIVLSWGSRLAQRIIPRVAPMSPGFDSRPRHLCALGFQSELASAGFSPGTPVFLLHLKLDQNDLKSDQRTLLESSDTH